MVSALVALAWNGVNLIIFFHTYAELSFVVEDFDLATAHEVIVGMSASLASVEHQV